GPHRACHGLSAADLASHFGSHRWPERPKRLDDLVDMPAAGLLARDNSFQTRLEAVRCSVGSPARAAPRLEQWGRSAPAARVPRIFALWRAIFGRDLLRRRGLSGRTPAVSAVRWLLAEQFLAAPLVPSQRTCQASGGALVSASMAAASSCARVGGRGRGPAAQVLLSAVSVRGMTHQRPGVVPHMFLHLLHLRALRRRRQMGRRRQPAQRSHRASLSEQLASVDSVRIIQLRSLFTLLAACSTDYRFLLSHRVVPLAAVAADVGASRPPFQECNRRGAGGELLGSEVLQGSYLFPALAYFDTHLNSSLLTDEERREALQSMQLFPEPNRIGLQFQPRLYYLDANAQLWLTYVSLIDDQDLCQMLTDIVANLLPVLADHTEAFLPVLEYLVFEKRAVTKDSIACLHFLDSINCTSERFKLVQAEIEKATPSDLEGRLRNALNSVGHENKDLRQLALAKLQRILQSSADLLYEQAATGAACCPPCPPCSAGLWRWRRRSATPGCPRPCPGRLSGHRWRR
uniref:FAT domain-containing protein n=1 Tax=Macrostomum lignano TaxID=282301 RepID=A0A1I8FEW4_9PLAT